MSTNSSLLAQEEDLRDQSISYQRVHIFRLVDEHANLFWITTEDGLDQRWLRKQETES